MKVIPLWILALVTCTTLLVGCYSDEGTSERSSVSPTTSTVAHVWPQFRGLNASSRAESWSPLSGLDPATQSLWKIATPKGSSSPIIWNDQLFLTGYDDTHLSVHCFNRHTGEKEWEQRLVVPEKEEYEHIDCSPAASTSCTDGERVVSYFGIYGLIAHDFDGNVLWERRFDPVERRFGYGSSPIIDKGRVYLLRDAASKSTLYCFDVASGDTLWKEPRNASVSSYSTPYIWRTASSDQLVVAGSGSLDGYDPNTGERLWTVKGLPAFVCTSPIASKELLVFGGWTTAHVEGAERTKSGFQESLNESLNLTEQQATDAAAFIARFDANGDKIIDRDELPPSRSLGAFRFIDRDDSGGWSQMELDAHMNAAMLPGRNVLVAVRPGGRRDITNTHVQWETTKNLPYVASPVLHQGRVYWIKQGGLLTAMQLDTGKSVTVKRLRGAGEYYATPIIVGDQMLIASQRGKLSLVTTDRSQEIVATHDFGESIMATPAVVEGTIYLRTETQLFALGKLGRVE